MMHPDLSGLVERSSLLRYNLFPAFVITQGKVEEMAMYAGVGIGSITDIPAAGEVVVKRIWSECVGSKV